MTRSIQQLPNNSLTSSVVEVPTQTGFNAGDLVYFQSGDYKGAPNLTAPSSANFSITGAQGINAGSVGGLTNAVIGTGNQYLGTSTNRSSALLTNGNIVNVWSAYESTTGIVFQIVNTSNVVQVSTTLVSSTYYNSYPNVGVIALTGGGFVVYWVNQAGGTAYSMNYAIYTNTGSVTTAVTQDTGFSFSSTAYSSINGVALANGGFALAGLTTGTYATFRAYSSTGVGAYSATNTSTAWYSVAYYGIGLSARSDNSIILFYASTSTSLYYVLINSSGGSITNGTISTGAVNGGLDATVLSDGTTYVLAYGQGTSGNYKAAFRFLPTGNTLGSEFLTSYANTSLQSVYGNFSVLGLSNGTFSYVVSDSNFNPYYAIFNSSGSPTLGTNTNGNIWYPLYGIRLSNVSYVTQVELSNAINLYFPDVGFSNNYGTNIYYAQISKTTFNPIPSLSTTGTFGSVSSAVSGISYASSTPTAISLLSSSTVTSGVSNSTPTATTSTQIYSKLASCLSSATLPNGQFLICYKDSASFVVYVNVYSTSGSLITTITIGTGVGDANIGKAHVAALPSGKFVVSYYTASTTITNALYSSSYSLIATSTITSVVSSSNTVNVQCAGLSNDRFVVAYFNTSSYPYYIVYDNTNSVVKTSTILLAAASNYLSVAANFSGGFAISFFNTTSTNFGFYFYENTAGATYTSVYSTSTTASNGTFSQAAFSNGFYYFNLYVSSILKIYQYHVGANTGNLTTTGTSYTPTGNMSMCTISTSGNGALCYFVPNNTGVTYNLQTFDASMTALAYPGTGAAYNISNVTTATIGAYSQLPISMSPSVGNNVIVCYLNLSGIPVFTIVNLIPSYNVYSLTSGTTSSTPVSVYPNTNTITSPVINGVLTGVAAQTVSSGSAGQVIINGPAQLNSNYTNTATGAFDHTGQAVDGVRGTYNGKYINLQGNS